MLVSFEWIKEFINTGMSAEDTAHALTMAGLEVEGLEAQDGDHVLEVNVTPNRPDCLSVLGIARELHAITGRPLKLPKRTVKGETPTNFRIEIQDKKLCARYMGRVVRGIKVGESPDWIKQRLDRSDIRSVNNVVDITNYVLLELGHPLHAFDLDTLDGGMIRVAPAGKDQHIVTLDGMDRKLPEEALLIWDGKKPVAVAGVMGGLETEVTNATKDILIESAWFRPQSVRRTSKALGLKSESSYRFERGTDILGLETALDRAALLISQVAGGRVEIKVDTYPAKFKPVSITVKYEKIRKILGADISHAEIIEILKRLDLDIQHVPEDTLVVMPPSFRADLTTDADIAEEVARLYGYDKIPTAFPTANISLTGKAPERLIAEAKEAMRKEGLSEAINYSFMNEKHLDLLRISPKDKRRKCVPIKNPLRAEDAVLRTMLVPSLIENFLYNFFRGMRDIRIFEMARVFEDTGGDLPSEPFKLGGILYTEKKPALWKETSPDFYVLKGVLEALLQRLRVRVCELKKPAGEPFLHPGKSADIYLNGEKAGFIGELSPDILEQLDVKTKISLNMFELNMDVLLSSAQETVTYAPTPKFPAVERDIAIVVDEATEAAKIAGLIRSYPGELTEEVSVFDSFSGGNIPAGKKSLAFSIRYRSAERTLTDEEVETFHQSILKHLTKKTGGEVRGT
jgi:phenylalanyl-tRNA synthetase beta chain